MNHSRSYQKVIRRWYRPIEHECPECHRTLREAMTLTRRTVITLDGVIKLNHAGYRCPDGDCPGHQRTYRSPVADSLALPYFTFGLDIVLKVGTATPGEASDGRRDPSGSAGAVGTAGGDDCAARNPVPV